MALSAPHALEVGGILVANQGLHPRPATAITHLSRMTRRSSSMSWLMDMPMGPTFSSLPGRHTCRAGPWQVRG